MSRMIEPALEKGESDPPPEDKDRLRPLEASDNPRDLPYPASTNGRSSPSLAPGAPEVLMRTSWKLSRSADDDVAGGCIAPLIGCRCLGLVSGVVSESRGEK
jgi:hypothetical protein